ncbi:uncharacterized protein GIQ15_05117 [Arthroderma uncinatum]|uniref:uncharacterized protein n=1 Tax=Arthroderma uncinatum TaxID=74035 RepID=UPI00144A76D5|nr:uncharacterized protein GIQ15_05117 [Arthroderma uncinatum]KAF3482358.1 hypothetical protein GIQ15_05117 [Arthroderma uncinatum]
MSIPTELRLRIYEQLFLEPRPYKLAHPENRILKGKRTSIFRVNRRIHDEATSVFYGYPKFTIEVGPEEVFMMGDFWDWNYFKNLVKEKPQLEKSAVSPYRPIALLGAPKHPLLKCTTIDVPMGKINFSKMRSFHVLINLERPRKKIHIGSTDLSQDKETKGSFYMVADNVQKLESLLKLVQPNIHNLSVSVRVQHGFCSELGDVLGFSVNALRWLSGLQFVTNASIETVEWGSGWDTLRSSDYITDISSSRQTLVPLKGSQVSNDDMPMYDLFLKELDLWKTLVTSTGGRASTSTIMLAFSKLENLLWVFQAAKVRQFRDDENTLPDFIYRARNALHEGDLKGLNAICREAVKLWSDHIVEENNLKLCAWGEFIALDALSATRPSTTLDELLDAMSEIGISESIIPDLQG